MSLETALIIATFTTPEKIGTNPQAMLWLLPLAASISVAYKAMKMPTISVSSFLKETVILFGSIVAFVIIAALILYALAWLIV